MMLRNTQLWVAALSGYYEPLLFGSRIPTKRFRYLVEPGEWTEELAEMLAYQENISMTEDHWDVIRFMRDFYEEHQIAPDARYVIKLLSDRLSPGSRNVLFSCGGLNTRPLIISGWRLLWESIQHNRRSA